MQSFTNTGSAVDAARGTPRYSGARSPGLGTKTFSTKGLAARDNRSFAGRFSGNDASGWRTAPASSPELRLFWSQTPHVRIAGKHPPCPRSTGIAQSRSLECPRQSLHFPIPLAPVVESLFTSFAARNLSAPSEPSPGPPGTRANSHCSLARLPLEPPEGRQKSTRMSQEFISPVPPPRDSLAIVENDALTKSITSARTKYTLPWISIYTVNHPAFCCLPRQCNPPSWISASSAAAFLYITALWRRPVTRLTSILRRDSCRRSEAVATTTVATARQPQNHHEGTVSQSLRIASTQPRLRCLGSSEAHGSRRSEVDLAKPWPCRQRPS